jgi:hypothetical protein
MTELEVKALQKKATDKLRNMKKKSLEEDKKMADGERLVGDKLRLSQIINTFFN